AGGVAAGGLAAAGVAGAGAGAAAGAAGAGVAAVDVAAAEAQAAEPAGTARALDGLPEPDVEPERFWLPPVPVTEPEPALTTDRDLLLRQLPTPPPALGGADLQRVLRDWYR
ncbi:hypothetical protein ACFFX1_02690, partial [Dactylosporangium sucinum]